MDPKNPWQPAFGLTAQDVEEFKRLYKEEFGEELTDGEARLMIGPLLELYLRLARPLPGGKGPQENEPKVS